MGNWYLYDLKSRKALLVLMERTKRPVIITAGKILDLSLVTFTTVLSLNVCLQFQYNFVSDTKKILFSVDSFKKLLIVSSRAFKNQH
jgi:hypothetical protein